MLTSLLSKAWGYLAAVGLGALAVLGIYLRGRAEGKDAEQQKQTETALKQAKDAHAIDKKVRSDSDASLASELRKYQRD